MSPLNIISFAFHPLDGHIRRKYQIAKFLSEKNRVLFVDGVVPLSWLFTKKRRKEAFERFKTMFSLVQKNKNLYFYTSVPAIPGEKYLLLIRLLNYIIKVFWIITFVKVVSVKYKFNNSVLLFYEPWIYPVYRFFRYKTIVYECIDDHAELADSFSERKLLSYYTKKISINADIAIAVNPELSEMINNFRKRNDVPVLRHGVDLAIFDNRLVNKKEVLLKKYFPEMSQNRKIIVYNGRIDSLRVNIELLNHVVNNAEFLFVLIGSVSLKPEENNIFTQDNVIHFSFLPQNELAEVLACCDVGIIPFNINSITNNVRSLKLMEYFAMGLPVVATSLNSLLELDRLISFADNSEGFISALNTCAATIYRKENLKAMLNEAETHSWKSIVSEFESIIYEKIK